MTKLIVLAAVLVHGVAGAGTLRGDKAEHLTYALRYAGIKPATLKGARTFQLAAIDCIRTLDPAGNVSDYRCTLGTTELKDAAAYLLYASMTEAGFSETPIADNQIRMTGKNLSCTFDGAKAYDDRFTCTSDRFKPDVTITPKKATPKDLVQPVKIEKQ